ncbi:peptidase [Acidovorax sp. SUPP3334]|uniref:peptidase n=1 Tax=Acidovorax sp. SUPP3334 TaxID=2920881 RepID=UPI0023DE1AB3|nr:peptidase [Acidovorax sp. SUPP3334]GKT21667.1 peptidase [Acidovorax sp. SUPP3334]
MKRLHIFAAGTHSDQAGNKVTLTAADVAASAAAYDPAKHEAPLVVGHPRTDDPAYGWVSSAFAEGKDLHADPAQVDPAFAEMVQQGRFKKISSSFYAPDAPANPVPGVWYLKHVGFLGAQPPAVKGLRSVAFAEGNDGVVEFADWAATSNSGLWRRLRDWLIGEKGVEVADQVLPAYEIDFLRDQAQQAESAPSPAFAEPLQESTVTKEEADRLRAENLRLQREATARQTAERHATHVAFAEQHTGKFKPLHKDAVVAFLDFAESPGADGQTVSFGEGDGRKPLGDAFRAFLADCAPVVNFSEQASKGRAASSAGTNPLKADAERRAAAK